jgi:hypothetical protein
MMDSLRVPPDHGTGKTGASKMNGERYGRVQRGSVGTQANPTFEQNTPSAPLPHERHPSVHAVQAALGPCANSSSRIPVFVLDASFGGGRRLIGEWPGTMGRSAADDPVASVRANAPVSASKPMMATVRREIDIENPPGLQRGIIRPLPLGVQ